MPVGVFVLVKLKLIVGVEVTVLVKVFVIVLVGVLVAVGDKATDFVGVDDLVCVLVAEGDCCGVLV